jgi:phage-related protein
MRGITFINITTGASKHTADDWGLIMSEKAIGNPEPRISKVDMADRDGAIDQSEALRGRVSYKNRPLSFSFICTAKQSTWADLREEIAGFVHGKRLKIIDPDTPNRYYIGRCTLEEPTYKGMAIMFLTVTVDADPYRLSNTETKVSKSVSTGTNVSLVNSAMPVVPTITVSANMTIKFGSFSASLASGSTYRIAEITLEPGTNTISITAGSGTITFIYRQGAI